MHQYPEIPDLLGDLVGCDRDGCNKSKPGVAEVRCSNDRPVDEIMHRIADQVEVAHRLRPELARLVMAVVPVDEPLDDEEEHDPYQHDGHAGFDLLSLVEEVKEHHAEHCPCGKPDQHGENMLKYLFPPAQGSCPDQRECADGEHAEQGVGYFVCHWSISSSIKCSFPGTIRHCGNLLSFRFSSCPRVPYIISCCLLPRQAQATAFAVFGILFCIR